MPSIEQVAEDIRELIAYNWSDELSDYKECIEDPDGNTNAMFPLLVRLRNWIDGTDDDPLDFVCTTKVSSAMVKAVAKAVGEPMGPYAIQELLESHAASGDAKISRLPDRELRALIAARKAREEG